MNTLNIFLRYFTRALMLLLVMPVTNYARGAVAKKLGDDSAEQAGRLTLNPFAHLDPLGSLVIMLCGLGWSKPMPINVNRMKNPRKGIILISLTGPLTHFISAIICYTAYLFIPPTSTLMASLSMILMILASINVSLGVINLLPLPGMDGFNIFYQFAPPKFLNWYHSNHFNINRYSTLILLLLFFLPTLTGGLLDPLGWIINIFSNILSLPARLIYSFVAG